MVYNFIQSNRNVYVFIIHLYNKTCLSIAYYFLKHVIQKKNKKVVLIQFQKAVSNSALY